MVIIINGHKKRDEMTTVTKHDIKSNTQKEKNM